MRIIFMGSSTFALPALKKLTQNYQVVAVYTKEEKPSGRGMQLRRTSVADYAVKNNIPIFTPKNFKNSEDIKQFKHLEADIAVVAAYGVILPQEILDIPKLGCLNIHGSLLPRWRGAAPIHRAIMAGDKETGVAIMKMAKGLDEGDVFAMQSLRLSLNDNTGEVHDKLSEIGSDLLIDTINKIVYHSLKPVPQNSKYVTYAHKITKDECLLDFENMEAKDIILKINALNPFPSAYFIYKDNRYKLHQAELIIKSGKAGFIDSDFIIYCKQNAIRPIIIQKENKQKQNINDFLNGEKNNLGLHK